MTSNLPPECTIDDIDHSAGLDRKEQCIDCDGTFTVNDLNEDGRCDECEKMYSENGYNIMTYSV